MNSGALAVRRAGPDDIPTIVALRVALLRDLEGLAPGADLAATGETIRCYLERKMPTESYVAWLAECDATIVAATSLVVLEKMPSLHNPTGLEGYLMSVYTLPAYRRLGAAEALVRTAISYARERGINRLSLHASDQGRPLYERLGFSPTGHELRWVAPTEA